MIPDNYDSYTAHECERERISRMHERYQRELENIEYEVEDEDCQHYTN